METNAPGMAIPKLQRQLGRILMTRVDAMMRSVDATSLINLGIFSGSNKMKENQKIIGPHRSVFLDKSYGDKS